MRLFGLFLLFLSVSLAVRLGLSAAGFVSSWGGWWGDLLWASLLALVLCRARWWVALFTWVLWAIVYLGNFSFIQAMGSAVDYRDLGYLVDPAFVLATLGSRLWLTVLGGAIALSVAALLMRWCFRQSLPAWRAGIQWGLSLAVVLLLIVQTETTRQPQWHNTGLVSLHGSAVLGDLFGPQSLPVTDDFLEPEEPVGTPLVSIGKAKNVLLVVVEGVHGAYLPHIAQRNQESLPVAMTGAGEWAQRGWSVPDFLVHVRQTNRGLYAMLCGDYPRLDQGQPKPMQILNDDVAASQCLPHMLSEQGYNTAYIQAADLQFMSKNLVMPQLGFEEVVGDEGFPDRGVESGTGFSWGPTDDAFFQQSLDKVEKLHGQPKPFFATLLTVGTHYPYGVTRAEVDVYGDPRLASVAAADRALTRFLAGMEERGMLEDTLVIVTSDESHGIPGHWLSKNWGLFFALAPDLAPEENPEVFSSIDIPNSILDYLGLYPEHRTHLGRSLFRRHQQSRSIMLAGPTLKMLDDDGRVHSCTQRVARDGSNLDRECVTMASPSGRLFDRDYQVVDNSFGERYRFFWRRLMHSINRFRDTQNWRLLVPEVDKAMAGSGNNLAIAHNRVELEENSLLTVDFSLSFKGAANSELALEWAQYAHDGRSPSMPSLHLPDLVSGDELQVRYVVPHYGPAASAEFVLKQLQPVASGELQLSNYRYSLQPQEGGRNYQPRVSIDSTVPRLAGARFTFEQVENGPGYLQPMQTGLAVESGADFSELGDIADFANASCSSRQFSRVEERIQRAYLIYYNRPADPLGLAYWTQRVLDYRFEVGVKPAGTAAYLPQADASGIDESAYASVIRAFSSSDEYTRYFSNLDTEQLVENLFRQLFDQDAPEGSLRKYSDAVKAGRLTREMVAMDIVNSANVEQQAILANRLLVSRQFTTAAEVDPEMEFPAPFLSQLITDVSRDEASLTLACARIAQLVAAFATEEAIQ
jgi:hypothetical protein